MAASGPHHERMNPASDQQKQQQRQHGLHPQHPLRRTAENLPPPIFILLFLLFALYILFTSSLSSPDPTVVPDIQTSLTPLLKPIPKVNLDSSSKMSSSEQT